MKKSFVLLVLVCLLVAVSCVFADEQPSAQDSAGNVFLGDGVDAEEPKRDLYWAGDTLSLEGKTIGKSVLAAGKSLFLNQTSVGGNIRWIGGKLTISGSEIADNITAVGLQVSADETTRAGGVYLLSQDVVWKGEAEALTAAGETVEIDGVIHGDVHVYASHIRIGEHTVVEGTLTAESIEEPQVDENAKIRVYSFRRQETVNEDMSLTEATETVLTEAVLENDILPNALEDETAAAISQTVREAAESVTTETDLYEPEDDGRLDVVRSVVSCVLTALVLVWLAKDSLKPENIAFGLNLVWDFLFGIFLYILFPLLGIGCLVSGWATPLGIIFIAALFVNYAVSVPYFGAAVVRKIFPGFPPVIAAVLGAGLNGLLTVLPVIGPWFSAAASVWSLGHFTAFALHGPKKPNHSALPEEPGMTEQHLDLF